MKYRPEIDGLRALAVVPVILFHAGFELFSGGFVGVDIFFVISGYLITTIIITDLNAGRFSIVNFYERRARRILPALFSVVFVCAVVAWFLLNSSDGAKFAKSIIGVITFTSNFIFWLDEGYFESASELKPLLHTWSLAVEEQYYLFFPLLLIAAFRFARKYVVVLLIAIAMLSFALMEWAVILNAERARVVSAAFFLLPTRGWELLVGSLVAFYLSQGKAALPLVWRNILSLAGVGMILWATFTFDQHTLFPSHYALLPTLGTALIILYATTHTLTKELLSNRVLVGIGLLSYSAYLWHQPVFAFYRYHTASSDIGPAAIFVLLALVAALAAFTWKFIEQPFRNKSTFGRRAIFSYSMIASLFAGFLAFTILTATGGLERHLAKALSENNFVFWSNMDERTFALERLAYDNNNPTVLLVGSSRLMTAGSDIVGQEALNLSVSGASLEDLVTIISAAKTRYQIDHIYIGVDPWLLNDDSGQNRWQTIADQYDYWVAVLEDGTETLASSTIKNNHTSDGIEAKIQELYQATNLSTLVALDGRPSIQAKRYIDGTIIYNTGYMNKSPTQIEAGFTELMNYSMTRYTPSLARRVLFETLLKSLEGYEVSLVFSPYHPALYAQIMEEKRIFSDIENDFRALAEQQGIPVLGSYDPARVDCVAGDFYDGMHPDEICMLKVFSYGVNSVPSYD